MVAAKVAVGVRFERVRVVNDPPTPYPVWLRWTSARNLLAGERQGYITRSDADRLEVTFEAGDWWLID